MEFNLTFLTTAAPGRLLECIMPLEWHTSISSDMGTGWKVTPSMGLRLNFLPVLQRCTDAVLQTHTSGTEMYKGESGKRFRLFFWKLKGYSKLCKLLPYFFFLLVTTDPAAHPTSSSELEQDLWKPKPLLHIQGHSNPPCEKSEVSCCTTGRTVFVCLFVFFLPKKTFLCNDLDCWKPFHFHGARSSSPVSPISSTLPVPAFLPIVISGTVLLNGKRKKKSLNISHWKPCNTKERLGTKAPRRSELAG